MSFLRTNWSSFVIIAGSTVAILTACAFHRDHSDKNIVRAEMPVVILPLFAACVPSDGAVQMSLNLDGRVINGLEMVWNTPTNDHWDIQWNTPVGDSRLEVMRRNGVFSSKGDIQPEIFMDKDGSLNIDGMRVPLLATEMPCLFAGKWPSMWLEFLKQSNSESSAKRTLIGKDQFRDLAIETNFSNSNRIESCAVVTWGGFLGFFRKSSKICITTAMGTYSVDLIGPSNYQVKWWTAHESK